MEVGYDELTVTVHWLFNRLIWYQYHNAMTVRLTPTPIDSNTSAGCLGNKLYQNCQHNLSSWHARRTSWKNSWWNEPYGELRPIGSFGIRIIATVMSYTKFAVCFSDFLLPTQMGSLKHQAASVTCMCMSCNCALTSEHACCTNPIAMDSILDNMASSVLV